MASSSISDDTEGIAEELIEITDRVCGVLLNTEYAELSRKLVSALTALPDTPLRRGRKEIWACGIVYALGELNFLFDPDTSPCVSVQELCEAFGVKQSSAYQKALGIRKTLNMYTFDHQWTLPSLQDQNPYTWMIEVDGLILDARYVSRDIQETAFKKGIIPYIPGEGAEDEDENNEKEKPFAVETFETTDDRELVEDLLKLEAENPRDKERNKRKPQEDPSQLSLDMDS
jgi:uncharacterized protein YjeT (DUF2065 family)